MTGGRPGGGAGPAGSCRIGRLATGSSSGSACRAWCAPLTDKSAWRELLPPVRLLPDTPHRFRVTGQPATHVRLNIFPDGGVARLRLYGSLTDDGLAAARRRWAETA
jgi:allantoicase